MADSKLTPKQEAFCHAYIELGDASEAYRSCYNIGDMKKESIHRKACEVKQNVKVSARIEELQSNLRMKHKITVDTLLEELEEARQKALNAETPQSGAAVSATMGKAKLTGLDKIVIEMTGGITIEPKGLDDFYKDGE